MGDRITSIDTVRALAMVAIVAIHAEPFAGLGWLGNAAHFTIDTFGRFAVPFFFLTAGYLFARKLADVEAGTHARAYISSVGSIYVFGVVLYVPFVLLEAAGRARLDGGSPTVAVVDRATRVVAPHELLYYGTSVIAMLWFLTALMVSIAVVYLFESRGARRYLLPTAAGLHVVGIVGENYPMLVSVPVPTRDALFFGFFYTALGFWFASRSFRVRAAHRPLLVAGLVFGSVLSIAERYVVGYVAGDASLASTVYTAEYSVGTVVVAVSLFWLVLATPQLGASTRLPEVGRYAVGIYVLHPLLLFSLVAAAEVLALYGLSLQGLILWHLLLTPIAFVGSYVAYRELARRGIVDPGGSHLPPIERIRPSALLGRFSPPS